MSLRALLSLLLAAWLGAAATPGWAAPPAVHYCGPERMRPQSLLAPAVGAALAGRERVQYIDDGPPCAHARDVTRSLRPRGKPDALAGAVLHAFSALRVDGSYFSVEELVFADAAAAGRALRLLQAQQADGAAPRKDLVRPAWERVGRRLLLLLADARVQPTAGPVFDAIAAEMRARPDA